MNGNAHETVHANSVGVDDVAQWQEGRRLVLAGKLSLSHDRPSADGWPLNVGNRAMEVSQTGQLSLSSSRVDKWVVSCNYMFATSIGGGAIWWMLTR